MQRENVVAVARILIPATVPVTVSCFVRDPPSRRGLLLPGCRQADWHRQAEGFNGRNMPGGLQSYSLLIPGHL
jgi:hypothetical protein